jgi:hypothetical protein
MNRCALRARWLSAALLALASLALPTAVLLLPGGVAQAQAQWLPRAFPADALRGDLVVTAPPQATLEGREVQLAPGVRIRGENNMLLLSGAVLNQRLTVHYTLDGFNLVKDVWVLRPEELAKRWPRSTQEREELRFDALNQVWVAK